MSDRPAFTGRGRRLTTKTSVKVGDSIARLLITVGGIGTIVAVATVCLFLTAVVLPLFRGAEQEQASVALSQAADAAPPVAMGMDEYLSTAWVLAEDGTLTIFRGDDGSVIGERRLVIGDRTPTAWSVGTDRGTVVAGHEDGTLQVWTVAFSTQFLPEGGLPESMFMLRPGDLTVYEGTMVERTVQGQFRAQVLAVEPFTDAEAVASGPIRAVAHSGADDLRVIARTEERDGTSRVIELVGTEEEDFLSGETTFAFEAPRELDYADRDGVHADWLVVATEGRDRYAIWADGTIRRWARNGRTVAETIRSEGAEITAVRKLLGDTTLVLGRADGSVDGWFPSRVLDAESDTIEAGTDGVAMRLARTLAPASDSPVRSIATGTRSRVFAAGHEDGTVATFYMVSGERRSRGRLEDGDRVRTLAISPKDDAILAATDGRVARFAYDPLYPEASLGTLFAPIWYEGYAGPEFVWQSSAATDAAEPKLSLVPLVFGTLKATFYSMIFGGPIALLAAIYTSEFLNPRVKAWVKPAIEMMASLPSVVLGFVAALVIAPVIEDFIPATLAGLITVPFALLLGAFLWQLLPKATGIRLAQARILFVALALPLGVWLAILIGPVIERMFFGGSLRLWLNGLNNPGADGAGSAVGGWLIVMVPLAALAVGWAAGRIVMPRLRRRTGQESEPMVALATFAVGALAAVGLALLGAFLMGAAGFDVRGPLPGVGPAIDTYDQRNALVVGFVMGFAIIPIIYTIADDALSTVPDHLRGASLGAGATPWQTAVRIVIPTAMSGLFSAVMIGLGRAVGETMIVLMALGNTPVLDLNVFEGARTLAANLAVELPEAAIGSAHYRTLFLAALVLFAMTFVLNTFAETVRLRFRKRAYQL